MCARQLAFADHSGFHSLELQSIFPELSHHNEFYRDVIKYCPIQLRVFREIK